MNFDQYWAELCKKHPSFAKPGSTVELGTNGLKTLVKLSFGKGEHRGVQKGLLMSDQFDPLEDGGGWSHWNSKSVDEILKNLGL